MGLCEVLRRSWDEKCTIRRRRKDDKRTIQRPNKETLIGCNNMVSKREGEAEKEVVHSTGVFAWA
jgi:hypothetical protein